MVPPLTGQRWVDGGDQVKKDCQVLKHFGYIESAEALKQLLASRAFMTSPAGLTPPSAGGVEGGWRVPARGSSPPQAKRWQGGGEKASCQVSVGMLTSRSDLQECPYLCQNWL